MNWFKNILIFFVGITLFSCSELNVGRSFMDIMDHPDSPFFAPEQLFPVMSGDKNQNNGNTTEQQEEIKRRTPSSPVVAQKYDHYSALEDELSELEEAQTESNFKHYSKYKDKLDTISEKIYFLKLGSLRERDEYLFSKGIYNASGFSPTEEEAIRNREVTLGMNKDAVIRSWGRPGRIDVAGNPAHENERWAFYTGGKIKYIFFEGGRVQGWTQ